VGFDVQGGDGMIPTYPTPNKYGVYDDMVNYDLTLFKKEIGRSRCVLCVVQVGPDKWAVGGEFKYGCGNFSSVVFGPSSCQKFGTFDAALDYLIQRAKGHFSPAALHDSDSCVTQEQRQIAEQYTALFESGWPRLTQLPLFTQRQQGEPA
jgi:hypothetical protein